MARTITYVQAINEALDQAMEQDSRVFVLGEDVGRFGGAFGATRGLWEKYGAERVRDTAISEEAIVGSAVGAAMTGLRPVAELQYSDFVTICMDQVVNQAAKIRYMFGGKLSMPLVVRAPTGGYLSEAAQHSQNLEAWFAHIPGLVVITPSTPYDAKGLLLSAIAMDDPVIYLEHKVLYRSKMEVPEDPYTIPIGKGEVKRKGNDITLITYSYETELCLQAAKQLSEQGIEAGVIDLRTVSPIDTPLVTEEVSRTGRAIIVYEAHRQCGVGAELSALIMENCFNRLKAPVLRVAAEDVPLPYSPVLQKRVLPQVEGIVEAVQKTMKA